MSIGHMSDWMNVHLIEFPGDGGTLFKLHIDRWVVALLVSSVVWQLQKEVKKDGADVATGVNQGVASFSSWSVSVCDSEMGITRVRWPLTTTSVLLKVDSLNG